MTWLGMRAAPRTIFMGQFLGLLGVVLMSGLMIDGAGDDDERPVAG
jgi:hypothetical protein